MRPRLILIVCGALSLAIAAYVVVAPSGLPRLWQLKAEEESLAASVSQARADNARLTEEVRVLQGNEPSSRAVLEKAAREELGWVGQGEVVLTGLPVASTDKDKKKDNEKDEPATAEGR